MKKQLMIAAGFLLLVAGATAIFLQLPGETRAAGNTYYVSTTGNDANACIPNDLSKAKRTIQQGVLCAQAGETVMVKAGTYTENVTNWRSGSAGSPITVKAASGETVNWISPTGAPTLGNPGAVLTCQVRINDRSYIRIEGFIFRDSAASCVIRVLQTGGIAGKTSTPLQGIEIINNTFINNGGPRTDTGYMSRQIYLQYIGRDANYTGGTVNLIQGNTFQNNYGAGIDFDNSSDIRVVSNISIGALENKNDSNVNWYQANLIQMGGSGTQSNVIENNRVSNMIRTIYVETNTELSGVHMDVSPNRNIIRNKIIYDIAYGQDTNSYGIFCERTFNYNEFSNNIIYKIGNTYTIDGGWWVELAQNNKWCNNTIYDCGKTGLLLGNSKNSEFRNNIRH